jgi:hypothetical protein
LMNNKPGNILFEATTPSKKQALGNIFP